MMAEKKYPENKPSKHQTIRIAKGLAEAVEEFLETDLAKNLGFNHKSDVATSAIQELLTKYGGHFEQSSQNEEIERILESIISNVKNLKLALILQKKKGEIST